MNPLRKWLRETGTSQRTFAEWMGVSQPAVWRWVQEGGIAPQPRWMDIEFHTYSQVLERHWQGYIQRVRGEL